MAKGAGHLVCVIMTQYVRKSLYDPPLTGLTLWFFSYFYSKRLLHYINYIYYINSRKFWMVIFGQVFFPKIWELMHNSGDKTK